MTNKHGDRGKLLKIVIYFSGTKGDLRGTKDIELISPRECRKMQNKIKAAKYVECSALNRQGLDNVFIEAVRAIVKKSSSTQYCCSIS